MFTCTTVVSDIKTPVFSIVFTSIHLYSPLHLTDSRFCLYKCSKIELLQLYSEHFVPKLTSQQHTRKISSNKILVFYAIVLYNSHNLQK